jgi:uncharacterized protein YndB with AHSA1/START domain
MKLRRVVTVDKPLDEVFAYLADFTTTTDWDPGTVSTVRITGDGGVGSEYLNTSTFAGRQTQLTYVVQELVPHERVALRGENKTVVARDTMTFRTTQKRTGSAGSAWGSRSAEDAEAADTLTEVTYTAVFTFKGLARFLAPVLRPAFTRLGDQAETGMAQALARL